MKREHKLYTLLTIYTSDRQDHRDVLRKEKQKNKSDKNINTRRLIHYCAVNIA